MDYKGNFMSSPILHPSTSAQEARRRSLIEHYESLYVDILRLHSLRRRIRSQMEVLPGFFNREAGLGRLRLRACSYRKHESPYRLSWILMARRRVHPDIPSFLAPKPKWPFKSLSIRNSRDLDTAIHRGLMDSRRKLVFAYHRKACTLNAASKLLSSALLGLRKLLSRFEPETHIATSLLRLPSYDLPPDVRRCLCLLRGAILSLNSVQDALEGIAWRYDSATPVPKVFLALSVDQEHRYGRLLWVHRHLGPCYTALTDCEKRRMRLSGDERKLLTPFELERRSVSKSLSKITGILRQIRLRIPAAVRRGNTILMEGGYALIADRALPESRGVPQPPSGFAASTPGGEDLGHLPYPAPLHSPKRQPAHSSSVPPGTSIDSSPRALTICSGIDDAPDRGEKG